uniref:Uncharacterized protein n=1 Tax=Micrurus corallinus TaxID=54390 RepID=A0A2D4F2J9_MICCO
MFSLHHLSCHVAWIIVGQQLKEHTHMHEHIHAYVHTYILKNMRSGVWKQVQGTDEVCNLDIKHPDRNLFCCIKQLGDETRKEAWRFRWAGRTGGKPQFRVILASKS